MSERRTPYLARAYEIMADGKWHNREAVMREMFKVILPGQAVRAAEAVRKSSGRGEGPEERVKARSTAFLVASGRRHLARSTLRSSKRVEQRMNDGVVEVRLRDAIVWRPPKVEHQPLTSPRAPRRANAAGRVTPYLQAAYALLEDGKWHDREEVFAVMFPLIPEEDAEAATEYRRTWPYVAKGLEPPPRKRSQPHERIIAIGRRSIAVEALANNKRVLRRKVGDRTEVQLRPALPQGRPRAGIGQMELGGGIEPHS